MNCQKEFAPIILLLVIVGVIVVSGGIYYYQSEVPQNKESIIPPAGTFSQETKTTEDSFATKKEDKQETTTTKTPDEKVEQKSLQQKPIAPQQSPPASVVVTPPAVQPAPPPTPVQSPLPPPTVPQYQPDPGLQNTAIILFNFPDKQTKPFDISLSDSVIFASPSSMKAYLKEVSYNKLLFNGRSYGWYTMPHNRSSYCTQINGDTASNCNFTAKWITSASAAPNTLLEDAIEVSRQYVNYSEVKHVILVFSGVNIAVGYNGLWVSSSGDVSIRVAAFSDYIIEGKNLATLAHEFGHSLGAAHAGGWRCGSNIIGPSLDDLTSGGCTVENYADGQDAMGINTYHYSAVRKEEMGFLEQDQTTIVQASGEYLLDQLELPSGGIKQLKIPLGTGRDYGGTHYYTIEYRKPVGFDATDGQEKITDGVLLRVKLAANAVGGIDTLRPREPSSLVINPGSPFVDNYRNIKVEVSEKLGNQVRVKITK